MDMSNGKASRLPALFTLCISLLLVACRLDRVTPRPSSSECSLNALANEFTEWLDHSLQKRRAAPFSAADRTRCAAAGKASTAALATAVNDIYGSPAVFVDEASVLDFVEEVQLMERHFAAKGLALEKHVLALDRGSQVKLYPTYQNVLRAFVVSKLLDLALTHRLEFVTTVPPAQEDKQEAKPVAQVTALPTHVFDLAIDGKPGRCIDVPLRLAVRAPAQALRAFAQDLYRADFAFPIAKAELQSRDPLTVVIECRGYYWLPPGVSEQPKPYARSSCLVQPPMRQMLALRQSPLPAPR